MKNRILLTAAAALLMTATVSYSQTDPRPFRKALDLYMNGMYERARNMFENNGNDPVNQGYAVLCSMKLRSSDYEQSYRNYLSNFHTSTLVPQMRYQYALNIFDEGRYGQAAAEFAQIPMSEIAESDRAEAMFKSGYCDYAQGYFGDARVKFNAIDLMPVNDYTGTARYLNGYMDYLGSQFSDAVKWFRLTENDPRFSDLSKFYLVDCQFNLKNYDFVIEEGVKLYDSVPEERRERLSRIISESYLVKGDKVNARKFFDGSSHSDMTRSDWFYAGSVLYGVEDYRGAIENYTRMTDRTDSLGQLANYHLGYSYIKTRNNVAAMEAFKDASLVDFDAEIREDAAFNYAKLAFDLNKDTSGFTEYVNRYSTRTKGDMIYGYIALASLVDRDYAAAVDAYDHIDELDDAMRSNYTKANYLRAEQLVSTGAWRDAVPCLRTSAYYLPKTDRFNQLSRYWMGECQYRLENYSEARELFSDLYNGSALQGRPEARMLPYNIACCYFREQNWPAAAKWFDSCIAAPGDLDRQELLIRRADCDFGRKDYNAAVQTYQAAYDAYPSADNIYPYYQQAMSYGLSGNRQKKASVLSRVEQASPSAPMYADAMYEYGRSLMDIKDNNKAANVFRALRRNAPDSTYAARALLAVALCNRNVGLYDRAINYNKEAMQALPGSQYAEEALLAIESICTAKGQPEKYLEFMEENRLLSKKSESDKADIYFNTAEQVFLGGNSQQSVASLQKYLDEYPRGEKSAQAWFYLAESYKALGNKEKAVEAYSKAVDLGADGSFGESARLGYANMSYSLERWSDAYDGYRNLSSVARLDANRLTASAGMMRSAYRARSYEAAVEAADAVMGNGKSSNELKREARYVKAKSCLGSSRRSEAMDIFRQLAADMSTPEGAEAKFILIQDLYDTGEFKSVEGAAYDFSEAGTDQSYWLARAFIVLGDSFLERGMMEQAKATYESVRDGYSSSDPKDDVQSIVEQRIQRLKI